MRIYRFLLCVLTIAGMVAAAITLRNPAARSVGAAQSHEPAPSFSGLDKAPSDGSATRLLTQAVARISGPQSGWIESGAWLKAYLPGLSFEGQGRYVRAPDQRFRLELEACLNGESASRTEELNHCTILSVSDGRDLWAASRIGSSGWRDVTRLRLSQILAGPARSAQARREFLTGPALQGPELLLRTLQGQIDWVGRDDEGKGTRLTGRWKDWMLTDLVQPKKPWPAALPRFCRLTLSGERLWPGRLEWWGPQQEGGVDRLLAELEFRDPVFDRPVSPGECLKLFAFDPGDAEVQDVTPVVQADMTQRAKHEKQGKR